MTPNDPEALQVTLPSILSTQEDRLNLDYLRSRSETLGVEDLLARALEEIEG